MPDLAKTEPSRRIAGVYAVTPDEPDTARLVSMVEAALAGGVRWVQYRNKGASPDLRQVQAQALKAVCDRHSSELIINDHVELALRVNASGVHIGSTDGDVASARAELGRSGILGVSCYASTELARASEKAGADYVAFGSLFPSPTKPGAARAPLSAFVDARRDGIQIPLVGIGGISIHNVEQLIDAKADAAAIIAALFEDPTASVIRARAAALVRCFDAR